MEIQHILNNVYYIATDRQTKPTGGQTDRQTDKQIDRQCFTSTQKSRLDDRNCPTSVIWEKIHKEMGASANSYFVCEDMLKSNKAAKQSRAKQDIVPTGSLHIHSRRSVTVRPQHTHMTIKWNRHVHVRFKCNQCTCSARMWRRRTKLDGGFSSNTILPEERGWVSVRKTLNWVGVQKNIASQRCRYGDFRVCTDVQEIWNISRTAPASVHWFIDCCKENETVWVQWIWRPCVCRVAWNVKWHDNGHQ